MFLSSSSSSTSTPRDKLPTCHHCYHSTFCTPIDHLRAAVHCQYLRRTTRVPPRSPLTIFIDAIPHPHPHQYPVQRRARLNRCVSRTSGGGSGSTGSAARTVRLDADSPPNSPTHTHLSTHPLPLHTHTHHSYAPTSPAHPICPTHTPWLGPSPCGFSASVCAGDYAAHYLNAWVEVCL